MSTFCMELPTDPARCKGVFFRYKVSHYVKDNSFGTKVAITPLKLMSCKGCPECTSLREFASDYVREGGGAVRVEQGAKSGDTLMLDSVLASKGFEGEPDEYDPIFKRVTGRKP